jgi:hypothetical protein
MDLLLDTTIQIDRITGSKERKEAVEKILKDNKLYCTTYVLGEYYSNIVNDLVTLYSLFLLDKDIGETGKRITEKVFGRSQSRVSKLYANILDMCNFDVDEVEDTFQLYMDLIQDEFYLNLEEVLNKTKCVRAERKIAYEDGRPVLSNARCRKGEENCDICLLWKEAEQETEQILMSEEMDEKILKILRAAKENSREYRGNNCKTLGDTVISLEAKKSEYELRICSSNRKDFQPICEAIGLQLVVPDYSGKK